jgi:ATP-dependent Clp protease ATP-binding subunit ClpA
VFERFTDRARQVVVLAQEEARLLNHSFIGTEHILLGLLAEGEGVAARALGALDISLTAVRDKVMETIGVSTVPSGAGRPFTPRAKKVLELSLREALQLNHHYIGTEHLLLGLVREGEGVGARVLVSLGADLPMVRHRVMELLSGYEAPDSSLLTEDLVEPEGPPYQDLVSRIPSRSLEPSADPPDCPHCGASLTEHARQRLLPVPSVAEGEPAQPFLVVFCDRCGQALAFKPGP